MRFIIGAIALLVIGAIAVSLAAFILGRSSLKLAEGELRCEGAGAVIVNVGGTDYAVNAMAGLRYPPIQGIWNNATHPETNIERIIDRGLTLCDWQSVSQSSLYAQR
jgi:hypothetical protein